MPLLVLGKDISNYAKIDPTLASLRVTPRPVETNRNYSHLSAPTGLITGVTAGSPVFQFQNMGPDLTVIKRVKICFTLTTAFGAAQYLDFGLIITRNITVYGTAGTLMTNVPLSGSNCKLASDSYCNAYINCRVSTTGTFGTVGTRTADTYYLGQTGAWMGAIGATIPLTTLFEATPGRYPITLAPGEGIEIAPITSMGATGVGILGITIEFADTAAY